MSRSCQIDKRCSRQVPHSRWSAAGVRWVARWMYVSLSSVPAVGERAT